MPTREKTKYTFYLVVQPSLRNLQSHVSEKTRPDVYDYARQGVFRDETFSELRLSGESLIIGVPAGVQPLHTFVFASLSYLRAKALASKYEEVKYEKGQWHEQ
jgi:hypothetical protein